MNLQPSRLIDFFEGRLPNGSGKYLADILAFDDFDLENYHDYIQWVFPLKERSLVNWSAPVLDDVTIQEFKARPELQEKLLAVFQKMMAFYGFKITESGPGAIQIVKSEDFPEKRKNWLYPNSHNHLRITRILTSVALLGLELYSRAFLTCLEQVNQEDPGHVTTESLRYWRDTRRVSGN